MKWELSKNIKSTGFILMTVMIPLLMLAGSLVPMFIMDNAFSADQKSVAVLDKTPDLSFSPMFSGLEANDTKYELFTASEEALKDQVLLGEFDGGLVFSEEYLTRGVVPLYLHDMELEGRAKSLVGPIVHSSITENKLKQLGLSQEELVYLATPVNLQVASPDRVAPINGEPEKGERTEEGLMPTVVVQSVLPIIAGILLFVSVLILGQILMYGVIKEKKNRIVEILLSSLSATELLAGKIISFGLLSMTQIFIWVATGYLAATRIAKVPLPLESSAGTLIPLALYFILGYLMLSSLFAALGAIMKDAESGSQVQGMLVLIPMFPIFLTTPIMLHPEATWISVISFIPIFTPGMMLLRTGLTEIPLWEIVATLVVLAVSVVFAIRISARIFEGSILQVDTATSLKEMRNMLFRSRSA